MFTTSDVMVLFLAMDYSRGGICLELNWFGRRVAFIGLKDIILEI